MTKHEVDSIVNMIRKLWPRCKWTEDEQDVFEERAERVSIELAQAEAAIRNVKATSDKFPQIATLLKALDNARNRPVVQADAPKPTSCRLSEMARRNGLSLVSANKVEVVVADWHGKARASVRIRGTVPDSHYREFAQDMLELARAAEREVDEWWYAIVEAAEQHAQMPGWNRMSVEQIRARVKRLAEVPA